MQVHYFGGTDTLPPPNAAQSTWYPSIGTVWLRSQTSYGVLGLSVSFADPAFRALNRFDLYVPTSRNPAHPSSGVIDFPLRRSLAWLAAPIGNKLTSRTTDGEWVISLRWRSPVALLISVAPAPGHQPPDYLHSGWVLLTLSGSRSDPWRSLHLNLDMIASTGSFYADLALRPGQ